MLTVFRDDVGAVLAACDWHLVDRQGHLIPDGTIVFVNQLQINDRAHSRQHLRNIIADILWRAPDATHGYWERRDSTGAGNTQRHTFSRERFTQCLHKGMEVMG